MVRSIYPSSSSHSYQQNKSFHVPHRTFRKNKLPMGGHKTRCTTLSDRTSTKPHLFAVLPDEDEAPHEVSVVEVSDRSMCFLGGLVLHHGAALGPPSRLLEQIHELDVSGLRAHTHIRIVWLRN